MQIRETKLQEELARVDRSSREQHIDTLMTEMSEREKRLWFFENEDQMDIQLEAIEKTGILKTTELTKKAQKALDDAYIPPEVDAKRN